MMPITAPLMAPSLPSFTIRGMILFSGISRITIPRMTTARDCAPALPPWPATTGRKTARTVNLGDDAFEHGHHGCRHEGGHQVDVEPEQSFFQRKKDARENARSSRPTPNMR
jgi:hypothetical protein